MRKVLTILLSAAALAVLVAGAGTSGVAAYGRADQPLAQVGVSGNCDNAGFPMCYPRSEGGVGQGGIWYWVEIDSGGTGDLRGAVCDHTYPGQTNPAQPTGAISINGTVDWTYSSAEAAPYAFRPVTDPNDQYYLFAIPKIGEPWLIPTSPGHYSYQPTSGVSIQVQVAPSGKGR